MDKQRKTFFDGCEENGVNNDLTGNDIAKIIAGAITSLVIVGWLMVFALSFLSA